MLVATFLVFFSLRVAWLRGESQADTKLRIAAVKVLLDQWAQTKATGALTNYGTLAWEYTSPGELSNAGTNSGPATVEQMLIPDGIKQARYNLYLVQHDGSFGVHNAKYMRSLLKVAEDNVNAALGAP